MIKWDISIEDVVSYLNELIQDDRPAMAALISNRVPCNELLADHPTCQVGKQHGGFHVGMLGVINGMFGTMPDSWGPITFVFKDGNLLKVELTEGLERENAGLEGDD